MQPRNLKLLSYIGYAFAVAAYVFMGAVAAHPYDDAIIDQHAQLFYYLGTNPLYYLPQGIYWDIISIGSYFLTILASILGIQNVITIHLATKLFLIIAAFLSAIFIEKIVEVITSDKKKGVLSFFLFIFNPITFYTTAMYGSSIIVAIFFITAATYFVVKGEYIIGAIFYGLSMGTFIYPLLGVPILFRYVQVKSKLSRSLIFLGISLAFGALGQGPIYLFYLLHGSGLSGLPVGLGYLSAIQVFPPFSVFDIFNVYHILKFSYLNYLFYAAAIFSSLMFFAIRRENMDNTRLFAFLGIQGAIFSSLAAGGVLMSFPLSLVPFAILFAFAAKRNSIFVPLIVSFVTLAVAMETINNIGLPIYFLDLNHNIAIHTIRVTSAETYLAGFFFGLTILSMIPLFLLKPRTEKKSFRGQFAVTGASIVIVIVLLVLAASVVAPAIGSVPGTYYLQNPISGSDVTVNQSISNGNLYLNYTVPMLSLTPQRYYDKISMLLQEPARYFSYGSYNFTSLLSVNGNLSYPYEVGFPLSDGLISIVSDSKDINMSFSNDISTKILEPTVASYGSYFLLSYRVGEISGGNYTVNLNGSGEVGILNASGKNMDNGGKVIYGEQVDAVLNFYPILTSGYVNGMSVHGGQTISVPVSAYNYHMHFIFPGFYSAPILPLVVIDIQYGHYQTSSVVEGGLAFVAVLGASISLFVLRKR